MTPIKAIIRFGLFIFCEDYHGKLEHIGTAANDTHAEWILNSLSKYHKVEQKYMTEGEMLDARRAGRVTPTFRGGRR